MFIVGLGEALDGGQNVGQSALFAHFVGGEVGVAAGTVPVAGHWLRVERDEQTELPRHTQW